MGVVYVDRKMNFRCQNVRMPLRMVNFNLTLRIVVYRGMRLTIM